MATWKYTLIFEGRSHGWSETYYFNTDSDDRATALTRVGPLPGKRAPLLGAECRVKGQRLVMWRNTAGIHTVRRGRATRLNLPGTQAHSADQTNTSLLAVWTTADEQYTRNVFMGGAWDDLFPAPEVLNTAVGAWQSFWNQWVAACQTANVGWLNQQEEQRAKINSFAFDAESGLVTFTLAAPGLTWNPDDDAVRAQVTYPNIKSALEGTYLVQPIDATHAITIKPRPALQTTLKGTMILREPVLRTIGIPAGQQTPGTIVPIIGVSRKRGRPLLASRGRLPVQIRF